MRGKCLLISGCVFSPQNSSLRMTALFWSPTQAKHTHISAVIPSQKTPSLFLAAITSLDIHSILKFYRQKIKSHDKKHHVLCFWQVANHDWLTFVRCNSKFASLLDLAKQRLIPCDGRTTAGYILMLSLKIGTVVNESWETKLVTFSAVILA